MNKEVNPCQNCLPHNLKKCSGNQITNGYFAHALKKLLECHKIIKNCKLNKLSFDIIDLISRRCL